MEEVSRADGRSGFVLLLLRSGGNRRTLYVLWAKSNAILCECVCVCEGVCRPMRKTEAGKP